MHFMNVRIFKLSQMIHFCCLSGMRHYFYSDHLLQLFFNLLIDKKEEQAIK